MSVCLSVYSHVSKTTPRKRHDVQTSRNFLYVLIVVVARSLNAIRYVLPILWMTSRFHIMGIAIAHVRRSLISFARRRQQCSVHVYCEEIADCATRAIAGVTFVNDCVRGDDVCYPRFSTALLLSYCSYNIMQLEYSVL